MEAHRNASDDSGSPEENPTSSGDCLSFEDRLAEARRQRAKVLAAREADTVKIERLEDDNSVQRNYWKLHYQLSSGWSLLSRRTASSFVAKAAMVFIAALGFGIGSVLGLGMLSDTRTVAVAPPATETGAQAEMAEVPIPRLKVSEVKVAAVVALPDVTVSPPPASLETEPVQESEILTTVVEFVAPPVTELRAPDMPALSKVSYMREDLDPDWATRLRTVPGVDGAQVADVPVSGVADAEPSLFIHAPDGIPTRTLNTYVNELEKSGVEVAKIGRESFRVSTTHLRYYSADTAEQASHLADQLGIEARDHSHNAVDAERIELWLAGRPKQTEKVQEAPARGNLFDRIRAMRENR